MDINEIRDIMDVTMKLENAFKHIKYLCGKYLEMENSINPQYPLYNEFPPGPIGYIPQPNYVQDMYYSTHVNYGNGYNLIKQNQSQNSMNFNDEKKSLGIKKSSDPNVKPQPNINKGVTQSQKTDKIHIDEKKSQNNSNQTKVKKIIKVPQTPYNLFLLSKRNQIKKQYPDLGQQQLGDIMKQVWNSFKQSQKEPYEFEWRKLKQRSSTNNQNAKNATKPDTSQIVKSLKNELLK